MLFKLHYIIGQYKGAIIQNDEAYQKECQYIYLIFDILCFYLLV